MSALEISKPQTESVADVHAPNKVDKFVKKNVGAIHIKNNTSCLQRKIWNVLLLNAYDELNNKLINTHQISVRDIMRLIGFDSKNINYLKTALEDIVTTKLSWNIIDEYGKNEWGVSAALASSTIVNGVCSYAYSAHLREKLYNPEFYAKLNILIISRFSSGHALALYENCVRYRSVNQTPYFSLSIFCSLIGVETNKSYKNFKILNRSVIKPAIKEINAISDISISIEMKRENRKVIGLKFIIQELSPAETQNIPNYELLIQLQTYFCLTEKQASEALTQYSEDRIKSTMKYVEKQYTDGKVKKIAPYFLNVLQHGDIQINESAFDREKCEAIKEQQAIQSNTERIEKAKRDFSRQRREEIKIYIANLPETEHEALHAEFCNHLASKNKILFTQWKNNGFKSKLIETEFSTFIEKKFFPPISEVMDVYLREHI